MATFLARITVKPGAEAEFERIAADLYEATHKHESGVRRYEYWRGADDRTYYCSAAFDDFLAFLAHQTSDHHEELGPQITADVREHPTRVGRPDRGRVVDGGHRHAAPP